MNGEEEERVERILEKLSEIEPAINTVKKLQQSGLLAVLDAIAEQSDNIFNYASTMGILDAASAMARIAPLVSDIMGNVDVEALEGKLRSVPWKTLFSALLALLDFIATDLPKIRAPAGKGHNTADPFRDEEPGHGILPQDSRVPEHQGDEGNGRERLQVSTPHPVESAH
ncbi:hypothetical protein [Thermogymnomonas acidicola]|uniref:hypothetical protein n=1 Tax=Thermogymnomonas acidicola TaxID=399579 RepID=UPI000946268B|nr:hypothetical protein [Thermogymnomonas acidicola]